MTPHKSRQGESGGGDRLERLSKALKANIGRRKAQARLRTADEKAAAREDNAEAAAPNRDKNAAD
jgi:hypothetical protein